MAARPRRPASRPASRVVKSESTHVRVATESRLRAICVATFFGLFFFALCMRIVEVSVMGSDDLPFKKLVEHPELLVEHDDDVDVSKAAEKEKVTRREITDRNGMVLATSIETASLVANPRIIRHEQEVADGLHSIFPDLAAARIYDALAKKKSNFLYIKRHLTPTEQEAVNNLGVPGLFFEPDTRRVYPYGGLFAHTLGYVDVDNAGIAGVEKYFDAQLTDPLKKEPLQLSLDLRVQSILRDEMIKAVKDFNAIGATGVVMDMKNGELLAIASLPEFDPNQPSTADKSAMFNRATLGVYEMGSTFKTFTMAEALDYGTATLSDGYDASQPIHYGRFEINDAEPMGRWLSLPEIYAYSSNIGAAKMALAVGGTRQQEFLHEVGLFDPVSLEVPEIARPITPKSWNELTTMTVAYGHGMAVSPLQLLRAIAAVTGDGRLKPMTLVKGGNDKKQEGPKIVKDETIAQLRDLMRLVVEHGTGHFANAPGYAVGGKTGTAEKNAGGIYNANAKVASFVSIFPVNAPRYAILVMVDEPHGNKTTSGFATGGWVSAPVVGRVVQRMAPLLGMKPDFTYDNARVDAMWANAESRTKQAEMQRMKHLEQGAIRAASF